MKFIATTIVIASQLLFGQSTFAGTDVKGLKEKKKPGGEIDFEGTDEAFALVPHKGEDLKVNVGQWLVEYPDGTKKVFNDDEFKQLFREFVAQVPKIITQEEIDHNPELAGKVRAGDHVIFSVIPKGELPAEATSEKVEEVTEEDETVIEKADVVKETSTPAAALDPNIEKTDVSASAAAPAPLSNDNPAPVVEETTASNTTQSNTPIE